MVLLYHLLTTKYSYIKYYSMKAVIIFRHNTYNITANNNLSPVSSLTFSVSECAQNLESKVHFIPPMKINHENVNGRNIHTTFEKLCDCSVWNLKMYYDVLIHFIWKVEQSATENSDFLPALKTILEIKPKWSHQSSNIC